MITGLKPKMANQGFWSYIPVMIKAKYNIPDICIDF